MPHQCTACATVFPDGSKRMLAGCPECGGKKFQFLPPGSLPDGIAGDPAGGQAAGPADGSTPRRGRPTGDDSIIEAPADPAFAASLPAEDHAQANARRAFVSDDELPPPPPAPEVDDEASTSEPVDEADDAPRPDLAQLREELNEQFESIRIIEPGQYELNLMGLYDREEYIIALEEDGRYVIDVASASDRDR